MKPHMCAPPNYGVSEHNNFVRSPNSVLSECVCVCMMVPTFYVCRVMWKNFNGLVWS